jgi:hypothetical protein
MTVLTHQFDTLKNGLFLGAVFLSTTVQQRIFIYLANYIRNARFSGVKWKNSMSRPFSSIIALDGKSSILQIALDGEIPILESNHSDELSPEKTLLVAVLSAAVDDCRAVLYLPPGNAASLTEIIKATSAARFFLTWPGQAMFRALDIGDDAVCQAVELAHSTLKRLRINHTSVISGENSAWCDYLDKTYRKVIPLELSDLHWRQEQFFWAA